MQLALEVFTGAASGFLFPVLPASPTLFWFHNQHFFSPPLQSPLVVQLKGSGKTLHALRGKPQEDHLPVFGGSVRTHVQKKNATPQLVDCQQLVPGDLCSVALL